MKIGYSDFKDMLLNRGDLMGLQRFRMMFPDTYERYYQQYMKETGKGKKTGASVKNTPER